LGTHQRSEAAPAPEESLDADDSIYKATCLADHRKGRHMMFVWLHIMFTHHQLHREASHTNAKELNDLQHGLLEPIALVVHHIHDITQKQYRVITPEDLRHFLIMQ